MAFTTQGYSQKLASLYSGDFAIHLCGGTWLAESATDTDIQNTSLFSDTATQVLDAEGFVLSIAASADVANVNRIAVYSSEFSLFMFAFVLPVTQTVQAGAVVNVRVNAKE